MRHIYSMYFYPSYCHGTNLCQMTKMINLRETRNCEMLLQKTSINGSKTLFRGQLTQ